MTSPSAITNSASSSIWKKPPVFPADFLSPPPKQIACAGFSGTGQTLDFLLKDAQSYWPERLVYPPGGQAGVTTQVPQPVGLAVIVTEGGGGNIVAEGGKIRGVKDRYDATAQKWITQYDTDRQNNPELLANLKAGVEIISSNASLSQQRPDYKDVRVTTGQLVYDAKKNVYVFSNTKSGPPVLYGQIVNGKLVSSLSDLFVPPQFGGTRGGCGNEPIRRALP
jgi:hypothetical protein